MTDHTKELTMTKCERCRATFLSPTTVCERCDPGGWHSERERWREGATVVRAVGMDRYAMSMLAVTAEGKFVIVRDAVHAMRDGEFKHHDDLIRDLTATKKENTELLAENARMRRRLEKR